MERLKQLLAEPSPENWDAICAELEGVSDEEELQEMVAVCEAGLVGWPDGLRVYPSRWNWDDYENEKWKSVFRVRELFSVCGFFDSQEEIQTFLNNQRSKRVKRSCLAGFDPCLNLSFVRLSQSDDIWFAYLVQKGNINIIKISNEGKLIEHKVGINNLFNEPDPPHQLFVLDFFKDTIKWCLLTFDHSKHHSTLFFMRNQQVSYSLKIQMSPSQEDSDGLFAQSNDKIVFWNDEQDQICTASLQGAASGISMIGFRAPVRLFHLFGDSFYVYSSFNMSWFIDMGHPGKAFRLHHSVETEYPPAGAKMIGDKKLALFQPHQEAYADINGWSDYWGGVYFWGKEEEEWQFETKIEFNSNFDQQFAWCFLEWGKEIGFAYIKEVKDQVQICLSVPSCDLHAILDEGDHLYSVSRLEWSSQHCGVFVIYADRIVFQGAAELLDKRGKP